MWAWMREREEERIPYFRIPKFPKINFQLKWRKIIDKDTPLAILEEIERISWVTNPKIYVGCLWLSTYTNVRPVELINIRENDFDLANGFVENGFNKERKPKRMFLLDYDIATGRVFPPAIGNPYFFQHNRGHGGAEPGSRFGPKYLAQWWNRACVNLGIKGVPLYPGTRHSSLTEYLRKHGYEGARMASGHYTNTALDRIPRT